MTSLDLIIFGSAGLFVLIVALLVLNGTEGKKRAARLARMKHRTARGTPQATSLSRRQDNSLGRFCPRRATEKLSGRIHTAGLSLSLRQYLTLCLEIAFVAFLCFFLLQPSPLLALLLAFVLGIGLPHFYVGFRLAKRRRQFLRLFPDAIELIVRGLRAGLPVAESMQNVAQEIPEPVGPVFEDICTQIKLGIPLDKSMATVAARLELTEFNFFTVSITLQRETGGNPGEILSNLAEVLRRRHIMKLKIRAISSEARASALIVGSLPFLVIIALSISSPEYLKPMVEDFRGNLASLAALASLGTGIFIMTRMAQFKI